MEDGDARVLYDRSTRCRAGWNLLAAFSRSRARVEAELLGAHKTRQLLPPAEKRKATPVALHSPTSLTIMILWMCIRGSKREKRKERTRDSERVRADILFLNIKIMLIRFNRISHDDGEIAWDVHGYWQLWFIMAEGRRPACYWEEIIKNNS